MIKQLSLKTVHGENCVLDSIMVASRHPTELCYFTRIYGVEANIVDDLYSNGFSDIIEVINFVGGIHLDGKVLAQAHSSCSRRSRAF
ncbi:hypothetical protein N7474_002761 [Penicillium riverlandense]|uniref:uncharacterized protein n=1 Tax=Penicillium riverlandense TaxID=1903569 RepID=UPI0025498B5B|nr:uncharacterized protein N7474_002761 [Penicillium riverlandense]KAJ5825623.1 hypothetical protein N7474_002761 [Penicillium riverlandense]